MTTTVIHKRDERPGDIYIGRPSKWGNPFSHLGGKTRARYNVATREEAVESYARWLEEVGQQDLLAAIHTLKGKRLVCWCKPQACHGDILAALADSDRVKKCEAHGYYVDWCVDCVY